MMGELHDTPKSAAAEATLAPLTVPGAASRTLSIIIVSWNVRELLADCLDSIGQNRAAIDLEVIVVDSGSTDDSPGMVSEHYPWVKLIDCQENVGFPRGNNLGMAAANGRFLLLLNPDTVVLEDALGEMLRYLETNPEVGLVGGQLLNPDGSVQSSRRRFPTLATAVFESTWLQTYAPGDLLQHYYMEDVPENEACDVDWLVGACLMVRREVVVQAGMMDEAYFMYSEELDWCRRIKDAGWRIVYVPAARITHHVGKSSEQAVTRRHVNYQRAKLRYFYKYHGRAAGVFLRAILLLNYGWQLAVEAAKYLVGHKRGLRRQRIAAYWQVLRTGLPPAGY